MRSRTRTTAAAGTATALALVGAGCLLQPGAASAEAPADLVRNGSFESPAAPEAGLVGNFPEIPGWVETTGRGMEVQNGLYPPPDGGGAQYVELDSRGPSSFFQDVATVEGVAYRLTFRYTARPHTPAADNAFEVTFGETTQSIALAPVAAPEWRTSSMDVVATGPTTRLTFADSTGPSGAAGLGALLDLVSIVPVG